ncbi:MAG: hypothetical protein RR951_10335, partial [Ruthenibacterium sp.]
LVYIIILKFLCQELFLTPLHFSLRFFRSAAVPRAGRLSYNSTEISALSTLFSKVFTMFFPSSLRTINVVCSTFFMSISALCLAGFPRKSCFLIFRFLSIMMDRDTGGSTFLARVRTICGGSGQEPLSVCPMLFF